MTNAQKAENIIAKIRNGEPFSFTGKTSVTTIQKHDDGFYYKTVVKNGETNGRIVKVVLEHEVNVQLDPFYGL